MSAGSEVSIALGGLGMGETWLRFRIHGYVYCSIEKKNAAGGTDTAFVTRRTLPLSPQAAFSNGITEPGIRLKMAVSLHQVHCNRDKTDPSRRDTLNELYHTMMTRRAEAWLTPQTPWPTHLPRLLHISPSISPTLH